MPEQLLVEQELLPGFPNHWHDPNPPWKEPKPQPIEPEPPPKDLGGGLPQQGPELMLELPDMIQDTNGKENHLKDLKVKIGANKLVEQELLPSRKDLWHDLQPPPEDPNPPPIEPESPPHNV